MREGFIGFFLIVLLFLPFFSRIDKEAAAQVRIATGESKTPGDSLRKTLGVITAEVEYDLPYPGILPDHPLYPLKVLRDRILEALIRDPVRKTEFYLLMADKRLNMGLYLTDRKKFELAETTVSKGEKYMVKGVDQLTQLAGKRDNLDVDKIAEKYKTALSKHEQVIKSLQNDIPENIVKGYNSSLKIVSGQAGRVEEIETNQKS